MASMLESIMVAASPSVRATSTSGLFSTSAWGMVSRVWHMSAAAGTQEILGKLGSFKTGQPQGGRNQKNHSTPHSRN